MMNNLMGGRHQGFYQDDNSRFGIGAAGVVVGPFSHSSSSSSCSSSPTTTAAAAAAASSSLEHSHQVGFPLSYYSYQLQPRGPTPTPSPRDIEIMRCYGGGGGGGGRGTNSTSQLHDHLMMISMDGSSSSPSTTTTSNNNNINSISDDADHHREGPSGGGGGNAGMVVSIEREHMFDKVVTPSDVGKLNRLVIPKQHAEKYFPLDSSTNEKGLLLNFEDRNGKPWRFRYSYWNSSQSYVMTKGWSRFVKEKKLDAGDIVSFQRGLGELGKDRLFIDWRRRPDAPSPLLPPYPHHPPIPTVSVPTPIPSSHHHHHHQFSFHPWNHPYYLQHPPSRDQYSHFQQHNNYESHLNSCSYGYSYGSRNPRSGSILYLNRSATTGGSAAMVGGVGMGMGMGMGMGSVQKGSGSSQLIRGMIHEDEDEAMVFESVPVVQGKAAAKRLRLFGVNMDCPISEEEESDIDHHQLEMDQCDILSSTAVPLSSTTVMAASHSCSISPLPLNHPRTYNVINTSDNINIETPVILQTMPTDLLNKGKAASMSLDLDI